MKKIYFHPWPIFGMLFFGVIAVSLGSGLFREPASWINWIGFIASAGLALLGMYTTWFYRHQREIKARTSEDLPVTVSENEICFPKGYYFKYSSIGPAGKLTPEDITEITLKRSPPSIIINHNEVIFFPHRLQAALEAFGERNNIPIVERFDIWSAINEPYLDTEFSRAHKVGTISDLRRNGVSEKELSRIRKTIRWTMLPANSMAWEWVHLSHFEYLRWTFLTSKKYWWSMEIALRNYSSALKP